MTDWLLWGGWHPEGVALRVRAYRAPDYRPGRDEMDALMHDALAAGPGWHERDRIAAEVYAAD